MNIRSDDATSMLGDLYDPTPPRGVGILSIAGALDDQIADVDAMLEQAGHTAWRRFGIPQTREGEAELRLGDVLEFLELYGHEYALVAIRGWSGSQGAETELVTRAMAQRCRVLWVASPGDPIKDLRDAGAVVRT